MILRLLWAGTLGAARGTGRTDINKAVRALDNTVARELMFLSYFWSKAGPKGSIRLLSPCHLNMSPPSPSGTHFATNFVKYWKHISQNPNCLGKMDLRCLLRPNHLYQKLGISILQLWGFHKNMICLVKKTRFLINISLLAYIVGSF